MLSRLGLICLLWASGTVLCAHDLYLLPDLFLVKTGSVLHVGFHNGDSFPESEAAPKVERLKEAKLSGKAGSFAVESLHISGKETLGSVMVPGAGTFLLSVRTMPSVIELSPANFLDYLKEEGLTEVMEWRASHQETEKPGRERYTKFAKSLVKSGQADGFYDHSLGFTLEIIPLADPYAIRGSGSLPVKVLFRGKAAAGLQLEAAWALGKEHKTTVIGRTGADGAISVPLSKAGLWRLHALKMERCAEPNVADWESSWASLTFEIQ